MDNDNRVGFINIQYSYIHTHFESSFSFDLSLWHWSIHALSKFLLYFRTKSFMLKDSKKRILFFGPVKKQFTRLYCSVVEYTGVKHSWSVNLYLLPLNSRFSTHAHHFNQKYIHSFRVTCAVVLCYFLFIPDVVHFTSGVINIFIEFFLRQFPKHLVAEWMCATMRDTTQWLYRYR